MLRASETIKELRQRRRSELSKFMNNESGFCGDYREHLAEWSKVADEILNKTLEIARNETNCSLPFCVLALGKLGGRELNYSSDVDIIFISNDNGHETSRLAQRFIRLLSEVTEDGFLYRADIDLRPMGKDGPLVNSIDALLHHYQYHGSDWERQALIRARSVAGNKELGDEFIEKISTFVYPRSSDLSFLKKIKTTKLALEKKAYDDGWKNFKTGPGGIREAEFFVQALQMTHGGRDKSLRTTNTLEALDKLEESGLISSKKAKELKRAYIFLRRVENIVQGRSDRQLYVLPAAKNEQEIIAKTLGLSTAKELVAAIDDVKQTIQRYFTELFEGSLERSEIRDAFEANIATCSDREEKVDSLAWFANSTRKRLMQLDLDGKVDVNEAGERISYTADMVIAEALNIARGNLEATYGAARNPEGLRSEISIVGMGRLASCEMDYASDLDLIFIYTSDGETDGPKKISAAEYFTKMATSVISTISMPTRYGRAFAIDTDLRPSGNQGVLVSSMEAFERYHRREAAFWERQTLLRARAVAGSSQLSKRVSALIDELAYNRELPCNAKLEIVRLRESALFQKAPSEGAFDLKNGSGAIIDIEFFVQYLQLLHGEKHLALRTCRTVAAANELLNLSLITKEDHSLIVENLLYFRKILARLRMFAKTNTSLLKKETELATSVANSVGLSCNSLFEELEKRSSLIRQRAFLSSPAPLCT